MLVLFQLEKGILIEQKLTNSFLRLGLNTNHLGGTLGLGRRLVFLHEGEGKDLLDTVVVGEEHDQTVDTHTPTTGGGQTVFQASTEVLVDELSLVVTLVLLTGLLLETETLVEGVVQLGVGVDDLLLADEGLETLAKTNVLAVVLGKGRHHLGVASNEGWVDASLLDELADQLIEHTGVGQWGRTLNAGLLQHLLEEFTRLSGVQLVTWRELLTSGLLEGRDHLHAAPGGLPVDVVLLASLGMENGLVTAGDVLHQAGDQLFSQVHDIVDIGVSPVELASREFGVVGKVNAFVTELTTHFVHTLKASNDKHLQVQLGSHTHEQVHVEVVVVSDEGLGGRTTGDGIHHGGFDLDEVAGVEEVADIGDNLGAGDEDITRAVVHNQVKVTLTETLFLVLETIVLGWDSVQARSQEHDLRSENRQLTIGAVLGVTATREADNTNNITSPEMLVLSLERDIAGSVLSLAHYLHLHTLSADVVENQLGTGGTLGVDSTGDTNGLVGQLVTLSKMIVVLQELAQVIGDLELVRVGVRLLGLAQLVDSLAANFEVLLKRG